MKEIKGIIEIGDVKYLTCCNDIQDFNIGGISLYDELEKLFNLNASEFWEDYKKESPSCAVKFVILDNKPKKDKSFNDLSAEVIMNTLYGELISGCYSEWTCGFGNFDYILNENGHSIFEELKSYVGKYIHLQI